MLHVVNYTLVYPPGQQPDYAEPAPEGVALSGLVEVYEFQTAAIAPQPGELREFPLDGPWVIAQVESYSPQQSSDIAGFHIAVCSRDGHYPQRYQSPSSDYRVLGLVMQGNEIVEREPGLADWWVGSQFSIPRSSHSREVLLFQPTGDRTAQGFDVITVCQLQPAIAA